MASKPTLSDSAWATDTNFTAGDDSGSPTKVSASAGVKAQGWRPGDALGFVGAWFNFWMNQLYLWATYLDDLHNSSDFLNKTYAWTGDHSWDGTLSMTSGNLSGSGSIDITGTVEGAAFSLDHGSNEYAYKSARGTNKLQRLTQIPVGSGAAVPFYGDTANGYLKNDASGTVLFPLDLPGGQVFNGFAAGLLAPSGTLTLKVYKFVLNLVTAGATVTQIGSTFTTSTTGFEIASIGAFSETINNASTQYYVEIVASATNQEIHYISTTFQDAGPTNK